MEERETKRMTRFYQPSDESDLVAPPPTPGIRHTRRSSYRAPLAKMTRVVSIMPQMSLKSLAEAMSEKMSAVLRKSKDLDLGLSADSTVDATTAELLVTEMGHKPKQAKTTDQQLQKILDGLKNVSDPEIKGRPPVITIMGHVDHGKTSLLDALRRTRLTAKEAGGITQQIGAYQVQTKDGKAVTFIDTPGHAAFTAMRARGANITDIVILLVAADDGVKQQTVEAIGHALASGAPIIVAINKIDKPEAKPDIVRQELLKHEIVVESLGGDIQDVEVSAQTGQNLDKLLEAILLQAEMLELKAPTKTPAIGTVLEGTLDRKKGAIGTVLVSEGTLSRGNVFVCGTAKGRVRLMSDDRGKGLTAAPPALPVEVMGFSAPPMAGDTLWVTPDDATADTIIDLLKAKELENTTETTKAKPSLENFFATDADGETKELRLVLKADTQGALEALAGVLLKIEHPEVSLRIIHKGIGAPSESDLSLAQASQAVLMAFGVTTPTALREEAKRLGVEVQQNDIIYKLVDTVKDLLGGLLTPEKKEIVLGQATVRQIFEVKKIGQIAGCYVTSGVVKRGALVRVRSGETVRFESTISTLKREQNAVREVKEGYECGMTFDTKTLFQEGDVIEVFEVENVRRSLDD